MTSSSPSSVSAFATPCNLSLPRNRSSIPNTQLRRPSPTCSAALSPGSSIVVSGGTGFIGAALIPRLLRTSAEITVLARDVPSAQRRFRNTRVEVLSYDASVSPLPVAVADAVAAASAVVNLAGEPVDSGRWTAERKRVLWDSRVMGTAMLARAAAAGSGGVFVQASACGFYGVSESEVFTETSAAGGDFLGGLAKAWENAAWRHTRSAPGVRTVVLRIGVVLANDGGALQKMKQAFRLFLGGPPGSGKQWFSFVHREDVVDLIVDAIENEKWSGTFNATAPTPVRLSEFCTELARVMGRPNWLPVPAIAVKAVVGSEAANLILAGQHVDSSRAQANGFRFQHPTVKIALESILGEKATRAPPSK